MHYYLLKRIKSAIILVLILFLSHPVFAQKTIQGIVRDNNNAPLPGVSVTVK